MAPLITIGLPVYNAAPYVEDALRSIFAQTYADWELIAIDDGSSDGSAEMLQRLNDRRVSVIIDRQHRGLGARLNQIVVQAAGEYVARMDADDLMHPARLERQLGFLQAHPEVDAVGTGLISFGEETGPISARQPPTEHAVITANPLRGVLLAHATVVGRTGWWRNNRYDEASRGCEDFELWLSCYRQSRFVNLSELLYFYREEQAYSFAAYVRNKAELSRLIWNARKRVGLAAAAEAVMGQFARMLAYGAARILGADRRLVRRRGRALTDKEACDFFAAVQQVRATSLPLK